MSLEFRLRSSVVLKYPLGFPTSGEDRGPTTLWVLLSPKARGEVFELQPVRHRASDGAQEWHLAYDRAVHVRYRVFVAYLPVTLSLSTPIDLEGTLRITVGELSNGDFPGQPNFVLTSGSLRTGVPGWRFGDGTKVVRDLWPTSNADDVTNLWSEPGGFFVEGRLPSSFFPPGHPAQARSAVLRLPRDRDDFAYPDGGAGAAPSAATVVAAPRPAWYLTAHPFRAGGHDSLQHARRWTEAFGTFALPSGGRVLTTLVDSATSAPDERCLVAIFRRVSGGGALAWFARDIHTRINLGGGGSVAEATFTPERLVGNASLGSARSWAVRLVAPPLRDGTGRPNDQSRLTLDLRKAESPNVQVELRTSLAPLVAPTVPVEVARLGDRPEQVIAERPSQRLWLCIDSGWAAIESPGPVAVLDPNAVTPGAILGVLELGRLISDLTGGSRPGLSIDAQATGFGEVSLELRGRSPSGGASSLESLALTLTRPFLTVSTPAAFYTPPAAVPAPALPALTSGLQPTKPAVDSPEFTAFLERLDREVAEQRFRRCVFTSENATQPRPAGSPAPLRADLEFDSGAFHLAVPAEATAVWQRPARLPLARSFPLLPDQDFGGFLDANRGVIPFRRDAGSKVAIAFFPRGLPHLISPTQPGGDPSLLTADPATGRPIVATTWRLTAAAAGGSAAYFLPTLPGLEFDPAPQVAAAPGPVRWVFRHGVPALDEAYAVAAEARRDPTDTANAEPRVPAPGEFPPGFDPTRTVGAEAFRFTDTLPPQALGWLHRTQANQSGGVPLQSPRPPELLGRFPSLPIGLAAVGREFEFSRVENVAGLSAQLIVTPPPDTDGLPSFGVDLAGADDPDQPRERVAQSGQPLLVARVQGKLVSHDGLGRRLEQPDPSLRTVRSRSLGAAAPTRRYSGRERLVPGSMVLDLIGIDISEPQAEPSGAQLQAWMLHDGAGGTPHLSGLPLVRRALAELRVDAGTLAAELKCVLGLITPRSGDAPSGPRDLVPLEGEKSLTLKFRRPFANPAAAWQLAAVEGGFDWRFRDTSSDRGEPELTSVSATVTGPPAGNEWPVTITRLELAGPTGLVTLDGLTVRAALTAGRLTVKQPVSATGNAFTVEIPPFAIDAAALQGRPLPNGIVLPAYSFRWTPDPSSAPLARLLLFEKADGAERGGWKLEIRRDGTALIAADLQATVAAPWTYLFRSRPAEDEGGLNPLPAGSWFERAAEDLVLAGARFSAPNALYSLACEIRLTLRLKAIPQVKGDPPGAAPNAAHVIARWSLPRELREPKDQSLEVSGWLDLPNNVRFENAGAANLTHGVRLFFDRANWSFDALFLGLGPEAAETLICLAEHRFRWGETKKHSFQAVQPCRFRRAAEFSALYLGRANVGENPDRLTIDGSWVFWFSQPGRGEPSSGVARVGSIELEAGALSEWVRFRSRPPQRGGFATSPAFIARLPFGCAGTSPLPRRAVRLSNRPRQALVSGAQGGPTIAPIIAEDRGSLAAGARPDFLRRGANARWIDATYLARLFSAVDLRVGLTADRRSREFLPGYEDQRGDIVYTLPDELGDWGPIFLPADETTFSDAACLRTPYVPHGAAAPMKASNLVEVPFTFRTVPQTAPDPEARTDVQLLTFTGEELRVIRRAGLEKGGAIRPIDWAVNELAAARRDEAALLIVDAERVEVIPRPLDPTRGTRERPPWPSSALTPGHGQSDRPPPYHRDPRERPPALADQAADRTVLDPPDADDQTNRWNSTPQWVVFAGRPEIPPDELKTRGIAATRLRLALAGDPSHLTSAAATTVTVDPANGNSLTAGSILGLTKAEETPFSVCDPATRAPADVFPAPGPAPHARREAAPRTWNVTGSPARRVTTLAVPLVDIVTWARRPGEYTRSFISGLRIDAVTEGSRGFRYSASPGQEITLRRPRAKAGPYEQVTIEEVATHTLSNQLFQYARLELTQTLDATQPPPSGTLDAVLAAKAEIFPGSADTQAAETKPALIRKPTSGGVEPFELWLVADKDLKPNHNFPGGAKPALRTVVVFQDRAELPPANADPTGPPVLDSDGAGGTARRVVLFETAETLLPAPPAATPPWEPLFEGVYAFATRKNAAGKAEALTRLAEDLQNFFILVLQYTKATDADDAQWVAPGGPVAAIKVAKIDAANEPVLPKCVASVLHAPVQEASDPTRFALCGYTLLDADDFSPVTPGAGPEEEGRTVVAWSRVANLQTLDRLPGTAGPGVVDGAAHRYDVVFYGPGGELVPIPEEAV